MKYIKGPFLVLPSLVVCCQHTFPALQSPPTINMFHSLEPSIPAQLVSFPSPKTYGVSQTFLFSLAGLLVYAAFPISFAQPHLHFLPEAVPSLLPEGGCLENLWTLRPSSIFLPHLDFNLLKGFNLL